MALERRPEYNTSRCQPRAITDRWSAAGMDTTRHQCDRLVSLLEPQGGWGALPLGGPRTRPRSRLMTPPPPFGMRRKNTRTSWAHNRKSEDGRGRIPLRG